MSSIDRDSANLLLHLLSKREKLYNTVLLQLWAGLAGYKLVTGPETPMSIAIVMSSSELRKRRMPNGVRARGFSHV